MIRWVGLALLVLVVGCNGPFFVFPGGKLDGRGESAPTSWSLAKDSGTVQLETDPEDPYSVNVVYTLLDGQFYGPGAIDRLASG